MSYAKIKFLLCLEGKTDFKSCTEKISYDNNDTVLCIYVLQSFIPYT